MEQTPYFYTMDNIARLKFKQLFCSTKHFHLPDYTGLFQVVIHKAVVNNVWVTLDKFYMYG